MPIVDVMSLRVVSVRPGDTVSAAVERMVAEGVGSVAVCDGPRLVGIFTERDVLRLASEGDRFGGRRIEEVMTTRLVTVSPDTDVAAAARLMGERRIRHLPVLEGENLLGVVGIRDVLGALVEKLWTSSDPAIRETAHELLDRGRTSTS